MAHPRLILTSLAALCLVLGAAPKKAAKNGGRPPQIQRIHQALDKLNLDSDQVALISPIIDDAEKQLLEIRARAKGSGDKTAVRSKVQPLIRQTIAQVEQKLTPAQRTEFRDALRQSKPKAVATTRPAKR